MSAAKSRITLEDALAALVRAETNIRAAIAALDGQAVETVRPASDHIRAILAGSTRPMKLSEITDAFVARIEKPDVRRPEGGTRYGEVCRTALTRMVKAGVVERYKSEDGQSTVFRLASNKE